MKRILIAASPYAIGLMILSIILGYIYFGNVQGEAATVSQYVALDNTGYSLVYRINNNQKLSDVKLLSSEGKAGRLGLHQDKAKNESYLFFQWLNGHKVLITPSKASLWLWPDCLTYNQEEAVLRAYYLRKPQFFYDYFLSPPKNSVRETSLVKGNSRKYLVDKSDANKLMTSVCDREPSENNKS